MLHRIGDLWIDGHHDDGAFAIRITLELAQQRQHFGGFVAIQTDGRLVGDDHLGFAAQGTRYCHAALIEFAQLTGSPEVASVNPTRLSSSRAITGFGLRKLRFEASIA